MNGIQNLSPSSFVRLSDALGKSTLPSEIKKELEECLEAKAASSIQGPARLQTMPQSMTMPFNYLAQSERQQLQGGFNKVEATTLVCRRVKLCGLKSMKEDTKKHIASFLVCLQMKAGSPLPSKHEMYKLANDVHTTFTTCQIQPLHAGLAKYPPSPYDIGQAFLEACYHADNLPLRTPPDVVDNFGMVLQEMKVRKNSKDLRPVATPQAASCAAADATGLEQQIGFKMMTLMLEQSKALDALKHEMELSKMTLPRASSSQSLSSADVSPHTSSLVSPKALDTHPDPLPLPP